MQQYLGKKVVVLSKRVKIFLKQFGSLRLNLVIQTGVTEQLDDSSVVSRRSVDNGALFDDDEEQCKSKMNKFAVHRRRHSIGKYG